MASVTEFNIGDKVLYTNHIYSMLAVPAVLRYWSGNDWDVEFSEEVVAKYPHVPFHEGNDGRNQGENTLYSGSHVSIVKMVEEECSLPVPCKIRVEDDEHFVALQEWLFKQGFTWHTGDTSIITSPSWGVIIGEEGTITYCMSSKTFEESSFPEVLLKEEISFSVERVVEQEPEVQYPALFRRVICPEVVAVFTDRDTGMVVKGNGHGWITGEVVPDSIGFETWVPYEGEFSDLVGQS